MGKIENNVIMKTELLCKSFVSYGEVNHVIKNMSLNLYQEDFTVIMGSSGSGKSTLLYLLSGMMEATGGKVELGGRKITGLKEKDMARLRREEMGFIFQAINLIPDLNVLENTISPSYKTGRGKGEIMQRAKELLKAVEMEAHARKFPGQLSGGQRQRAAICRALINRPGLLFADEPTGALNSAQGENVLDILTEFHKKGQSVVMVTHDLKAALRGDRILYLSDGRIDGDLKLNEFEKADSAQRESVVYHFLKERGW